MSRGAADTRLFPSIDLARAYRHVLGKRGRSLLFFGDPLGHLGLREALAAMLRRTRGMSVIADNIIVTRGSQMALDLISRSLLSPGDAVAVEALGYPPVWSTMRLAGARLMPVPVDESGMSVVALEALARKHTLKAVYLTPHHQFPTTTVMTATRRSQLLELARHKRWMVLEDDYDHEFHYDGRPVLPLASQDQAGIVIYCGTLSKALAIGLRLGFIAAPVDVVERLVSLRPSMDVQGDHVLEAAMAELFHDGVVPRHFARVRRVYENRRDAMAESLQRHLRQVLKFDVPPGGMAFWAQTPPELDLNASSKSGLEAGVLFKNGSLYEFDQAPQARVRLGFTLNNEVENEEAVKRMAKALSGARWLEPQLAEQASPKRLKQASSLIDLSHAPLHLCWVNVFFSAGEKPVVAKGTDHQPRTVSVEFVLHRSQKSRACSHRLRHRCIHVVYVEVQ